MARPRVGKYAVGCPHPAGNYPAPVHYFLIDGRLRKWACNDRNCADAKYAKATNQVAYHIEDQESGLVWTDFEAKERKQ
jgi:hypothetical protein